MFFEYLVAFIALKLSEIISFEIWTKYTKNTFFCAFPKIPRVRLFNQLFGAKLAGGGYLIQENSQSGFKSNIK